MMETKTSSFKGREYLEIYPYIVYENGTSKFSNGSYIEKGYYVVEKRNNTICYTQLKKWIEK